MSTRRVRFSQHARDKFSILRAHGLELDEATVLGALQRPERVDFGYHGRLIAQADLDATRVLRVVYEETLDEIIIVTFYPGLRTRYE